MGILASLGIDQNDICLTLFVSAIVVLLGMCYNHFHNKKKTDPWQK